MEREVTYMDCPAYMDEQGHVRCGLPAEVEHRYTMDSTDGPLESAQIRCPLGHWFSGPVESLRWERPGPGPGPGTETRTESEADDPQGRCADGPARHPLNATHLRGQPLSGEGRYLAP